VHPVGADTTKALDQVTAQAVQHVRFCADRFHALGHRFELQAAAHLDDGGDDGHVVGAVGGVSIDEMIGRS
jgi:hypothetical protein